MKTLKYIIIGVIGLMIGTITFIASAQTLRVITVPSGGTGASTLSGCLSGNGTSPITGSGSACGSGGGASGGTWSTTTSQVTGRLINYPNNATDIVTIGSTATTTGKYWFDPNTSIFYLSGNGTTTGKFASFDEIKATHFTATSTTANSTFAGNVGIGTASPIEKFHVVGSGRITTGLRIENDNYISWGSSSGEGIRGSQSANNLTFRTNSTDRIRIDSSGNVGIGTMTPNGKLSVYSGAAGSYTPNTGADELIIENSSSGGLTIVTPDASTGNIFFGSPSRQIGAQIQWRHSTGLFTLGPGNSGAQVQILSGNSVEAVRIDSSGNVGIGTTSPYAKLSVTNTGSDPSFVVEDSTSPDTTPFMIDASGNVGIGLTNPSQQLELTKSLALVNTTTSDTGVIYKGANRFIHNFALAGTTGFNTFVGENAGNFTMTGSTGDQGSFNTGEGYQALLSNTTGNYNSAQGYQVLYLNTTGVQNAAQGAFALSNNTTGSYNTAQGYATLTANTTGSLNSAHGFAALFANTTGNYNTASGFNAGRYQADGATALTTAANSVYLGSGAMGFNNSDSNSIVIGYLAKGIGANTAVLGNDSITTTALKGNVGIGTTSPYAKLSVDGRGIFNQDVRADYFTATSTTAVNTFPNASTTLLSIGGVNVTPFQYSSFTYATTTWNATTTIPLEVGYLETWKTIRCFTDVGTVNVSVYHGASVMNLLNASTTVGTFGYTTNNTVADLSKVYVDIGTPASSPKKITCTVKKQMDSN